MRIQDVQSDIMFSRRITELAEVVLGQHQEIEALKQQLTILQQKNETLKAAKEALSKKA